MSEDKFEWNDELVLEFANAFRNSTEIIAKYKIEKESVEKFKAFKQQQDKDYEILSYLHNVTGQVLHNKSCVNWENTGCKIHSVRRKSDNEVFSIDEDTNEGRISSFEINDEWWGGLRVGFEGSRRGCSLDKIKKVKQPTVLFQTLDGKDIYENDEYWFVFDTWVVGSEKAHRSTTSFKTFSTKEKAEEYIKWNKPIFSLQEIKDNSSEIPIGEWHGFYRFDIAKFMSLAKSKIG